MATLPPPSGINLQDDRGPEIVRIALATAILASLTVTARLLARRIKKVELTASDWVVVAGLFGVWANTGITIYCTKIGLGLHVEAVPLPRLQKLRVMLYAGEKIYAVSIVCIKISILLLYCKLFPGKKFELLAILVGAFSVAWGVATELASIFACTPINGFWVIGMDPPPRCINFKYFYFGSSVPNILSDLMILCLPVGKVWHLQMSRKSKYMVLALFMTGSFVVVASSLRMYYLLSIDENDTSYSYYGFVVWTQIELSIAVVSACLPTLRAVLEKAFSNSLATKLLPIRKLRRHRSSSNTLLALSSRYPRVDKEESRSVPSSGRTCSQGSERSEALSERYALNLAEPFEIYHWRNFAKGHETAEHVS